MMGPFADWAAAGAGGNWPIAGARRIDNASQETGDFELMFRRIEYTPCFYLFGLPRVRRSVSACLVVRVVQNEVLQRCVIPAKAGIQSPGTRGQLWMPAFAGMTLTFLSHPTILNDSRG